MSEFKKLISKWESEMGSYIPNIPIYQAFINDAKEALKREESIISVGEKPYMCSECGKFYSCVNCGCENKCNERMAVCHHKNTVIQYDGKTMCTDCFNLID